MLRKILLSVLILFLVFPAGVKAQNLVEIDIMQIDLWPEFDRPEVLVIYRMLLTNSTALPASLSMRIPAASGGPFNLAVKDSDGSLYNLDYTTRQDGEWLWVSFTTSLPELQLEYYDPTLRRSGNARSFTFTWTADYTVHSMNVQVQQPVNAAGMQIEPALGSGSLLQDGLTYYFGRFGEIEAGEQFNISLAYEKPDELLSEGYEPVSAVEPIGNQTDRTLSFNSILPFVLGGVGIALVLGVVVWYLAPLGTLPGGLQNLAARRGRQAEKRKRHAAPGAGETVREVDGGFCHQCGKASGADDIYCRACGTKLRRSG